MSVIVHMWRSEATYHVGPRVEIELRLSNLTASVISLTLFKFLSVCLFVCLKKVFLKLRHALNYGDAPALASLVLGL